MADKTENPQMTIEGMHQDLADVLVRIRAERAFDVESWIERKCEMLNDYMRDCGLTAIAMNLSGGVDSAVTYALAAKAKNMPNSPIKRMIGIAQPIHSTAKIQNRAYELEIFGPVVTIDQTAVFDQLLSSAISGGYPSNMFWFAVTVKPFVAVDGTKEAERTLIIAARDAFTRHLWVQCILARTQPKDVSPPGPLEGGNTHPEVEHKDSDRISYDNALFGQGLGQMK
ncbi:hypothetical protein KIPB_008664, partial [Kipferlia bialata]|eukprot:g8664.t1